MDFINKALSILCVKISHQKKCETAHIHNYEKMWKYLYNRDYLKLYPLGAAVGLS